MNDTPTTDARWETLCCSGQSWYQIAEEMKLDCRQRERELTAVTEQRDRLAEALIKCREDSVCEQVRMEKCRYTKAADESQANIDRADKALQYLNQPTEPESKDPHRFCRGGGGNNFHCGCKYAG
jgi:hypothetical protein